MRVGAFGCNALRHCFRNVIDVHLIGERGFSVLESRTAKRPPDLSGGRSIF